MLPEVCIFCSQIRVIFKGSVITQLTSVLCFFCTLFISSECMSYKWRTLQGSFVPLLVILISSVLDEKFKRFYESKKVSNQAVYTILSDVNPEQRISCLNNSLKQEGFFFGEQFYRFYLTTELYLFRYCNAQLWKKLKTKFTRPLRH